MTAKATRLVATATYATYWSCRIASACISAYVTSSCGVACVQLTVTACFVVVPLTLGWTLGLVPVRVKVGSCSLPALAVVVGNECARVCAVVVVVVVVGAPRVNDVSSFADVGTAVGVSVDATAGRGGVTVAFSRGVTTFDTFMMVALMAAIVVVGGRTALMVLLGTFSGISVVDVLLAASMSGTAAVVVVVVATGVSADAVVVATATAGRGGVMVAFSRGVTTFDTFMMVALMAGAALIAFTTGGVAGAAVVEAALTFVSFNPNQRSCPENRFVATAACTKLLGNP
jgi:hypothetical protein